MSFDKKNLDVHSEERFREILKLAGNTIECSWFIGGIRYRRGDNRWVPLIMFADEQQERFAYAFTMSGGRAEVAAFCKRLIDVVEKCEIDNERDRQ